MLSPPMNWKKWPKLLECESEMLGNDYKCLLAFLKLQECHLDWGCPLLELEDECREEVDDAVREFARGRKWPVLTPVGGAMLQERLLFARELMTQLKWYAKQLKMGAPDNDMDEEETICWFLIDAWHKFGFESLMNNVRIIPTHETVARRELGHKLKKDFFNPEDN